MANEIRWHEAASLLSAGRVLKHGEVSYRFREGALQSKYEPVAGSRWRPATGGLPVDGGEWVIVDGQFTQVTIEEFMRWAVQHPKGVFRLGENTKECERPASDYRIPRGDGTYSISFEGSELGKDFYIPDGGE